MAGRSLARGEAQASGMTEALGEFDYIVVNDDFDRTYAELAHVYHAERQRRRRQPRLEAVVERLMAEPLA